MARLLIVTLLAIIAVTAFAQSPVSAPANSPFASVSKPPSASATPPTAETPTPAAGPGVVADEPTSGNGPSGSPSGAPSNGAVSINRVAVLGGSFVGVALVSTLLF